MAVHHSNDGAVHMAPEYADRAAPLIDLPAPPAWYADALCPETDPEAFFPDKGGSTKPAKRTCASCPVRELCLQYAIENNERFGVWGGLSERQRRVLIRDAA